jgi:hypothetical protein
MTRNLYDRLKDNNGKDATKMQDITSEMFKLGNLPQANEAGRRAQAGIDSLKEGIERAAESVLGDDTESLRLAQQELNQLTEQLQREMGREKADPNSTNALGGLAALNSKPGQTNGTPAAGQGRQGQQLAQNGAQQGRSQDGNTEANPTEQNPAPGQGDGQKPEQQKGSGRENQNSPNRNSAQNPGQAQAGQSGQGEPDSEPGKNGRMQAAQGNGEGPRQGRGTQPGQMRGGEPGDAAAAGGGGTPRDWNLDRLLNNDAWRQTGPLTGEDFTSWSDNLREVEEMLDTPELRNEVAAARERARVMRQDFKRAGKKPDWAVVQLQVMKPLTMVRDSIAEELARRQSREALVPIDRDPVPNRYSELVRRYYEELGKSK